MTAQTSYLRINKTSDKPRDNQKSARIYGSVGNLKQATAAAQRQSFSAPDLLGEFQSVIFDLKFAAGLEGHNGSSRKIGGMALFISTGILMVILSLVISENLRNSPDAQKALLIRPVSQTSHKAAEEASLKNPLNLIQNSFNKVQKELQ